MFVKVCGITNRDDAQAAIDNGANALGFIFHPPSPRYIRPDVLADWIDLVPENIWRVGVFVNRTAAEVDRVCAQLQLDVAQLHGHESPSDLPARPRIWKAFRLPASTTTLAPEVNSFPAEAVLLDGASSGSTFNWALTRQVRRNFILAGGLTEENVIAAIEQTRPWGIDVCSSLESSPGQKDYALLTRFLKACQPALLTTS